MIQTLRELLYPQPKSKIKAGDGLAEGRWRFFTSSQIQSKYYHTALYEKPALIFGTGGMASVHYCDTPFAASTDCLVMYGAPGANLELIHDYLQANLHLLQARFKGAGLQHISKNDILEIPIDMPDPGTQGRIVAQMRQIDRLLALSKRRLAKLEELVEARFIEMFGDRSSFACAPLASSVEEMFIGPFGSSLKNQCFVPKDQGFCMVYEQKHAIRKTMDVETRYVDKAKYTELKRFSVHGGDIIVSCRGTIGETFLVPDTAPLGIMHPSIMKIRLKRELYNPVFFHHLLQRELKKYAHMANGSSVKMTVTAASLGKELFILPGLPMQEQFSALTAQAEHTKAAVRQSLDWLETLKKSILQQYFG